MVAFVHFSIRNEMKKLAYAFLCAALSAPAWSQDAVLARNEWTTVTRADFDFAISQVPKAQQHEFLASAERISRVVEGILVNKTLAAQARAAKIDQDPAIRAEIHAATEKALARYRLERAEAELKLPDFSKRAEELYKANPRKYAERPVYHTKHVLVDTKCRTPEAARARALEARAEIAAGKPIEEVARRYSDDQSVAQNGGDLGPLTFENLTPAFRETVQAMKAGDLSQPVQSNFGYHVIKLESYREGRQYAFAEVRESLAAEVRDEWLKQQRKAMVERITADPKLHVDTQALRALKTNLDQPPPAVQPKPSR